MTQKKDYTKTCPGCGVIQRYSSASNLGHGIKANARCQECRSKSRKKDFRKNCPQCGGEQVYSSYNSWNAAVNQKTLCRSCRHTERANRPEIKKANYEMMKEKMLFKKPWLGRTHSEETKQKLREAALKQIKEGDSICLRRPQCNNYVYWVGKYGKEEADIRQSAFAAKMSAKNSGTNNPMYGKPSPKGSGNGWSGWYKGWYFRSLKELACVREFEKKGTSWKTAESGDVVIQYQDWDGRVRNYFADFLVDGKELVECKPKRLWGSAAVTAKRKAAEEFCKKRGWRYSLVDPEPMTTSEIVLLFQQGDIKFIPRYEAKFREQYLAKHAH